MKQKSKVAKRFTALATSLVMALSMVPSNVFANEKISQIVYPGLEEAKTPAPPTSTTEVSADGKVTFKKTVSEVEGQENVFDINLEVTTKEDIKNQQVVEDTAVLLVVDKSISMAWRIDSTTWDDNAAVNQNVPEKETRMYAAKEAIYTFIEKYVEDSGDAERYVGLVAFDEIAYTKSDFVDLNAGNNLTTFKNTVKALYGDRGTNAESGLLLGRNLIERFKANNPHIENVHVIFLSDGNPTFGTNDSNISNANREMSKIGYTVYNRDKKSGTDYIVDGVYDNLDGREGSISIPQSIKDLGGVIYSVAFALSKNDTVLAYKGGDKEQPIYIADVLAYVSSNGSAGVFEASDLPQLVTKFEELSKIISVKAEAWQVTDPLPENVVFDTQENTKNRDFSVTDKNHYKYFDKATNTITWDVRSDKNTVVEDKENGTFTYKMNYRIILDNTSTDFAYNTGIETNETTSLTYLVTEKSGETTKNYTNGTLKLVALDEQTGELTPEIPQVQGFKGEFSFVKNGMVDGEKVPLAGATFTLTSTTKIPGTTNSIVRTATSNSDGVVMFDSIPSGYSYTLKEATAPVGFEKSDKTYTIDVNMGVVTADDMEIKEVINYKKQTYKDIDVIKNWLLYEGGKGFPLKFTLQAFDGEEKFGEEITVTLTEADVVAGTNGTQWKGSFKNVPTINQETGRDLTYVVSETYANSQDADKFTNDFTKNGPTLNADGSYTFTNIQNNPTTVSFDVTKEWVAATNVELPTVKVTLLQDGEVYKNAGGSTVTADLTEANSWTAKFENLPYYNERTKNVAVYSVVETLDETNFAQASNIKDEDGNITLTNIIKQVEKVVSGEKVWNYDEKYVTLPNSIIVELYADSVKVEEQTVTADAEGKWGYEFKGLDTYKFEGNEVTVIDYTVKEVEVDGFTATITNSTITNTAVEKIDIPVTKVWNGIGANYGAVNITLKGNNKEYNAQILDTYTFTDLDKFDLNGQLIEYTLTEQAPEGYAYEVEKTLSDNGETSFVLTNTLKDEEKTIINVTKIWQDPAGTVHSDVTLQLQSREKGSSEAWADVDGKQVTLTFGEDGTDSQSTDSFTVDGYEIRFGEVDKNQSQTPDTEVNEDVTPDTEANEEVAPEEVVAEEATPEEATSEEVAPIVEEVAPEEVEAEKQTLVELEFNVVEINVPDNYKSEVTGAGTNNIIVTNTITGTTSFSGTKTWVAPEGTVLPDVTIQLLEVNGTESTVVKSVTLANGNTSYSFDVPMYNSVGQVINYIVEEAPVTGYTPSYDRNDTTVNITNTKEMTYTPVNVSKTWVDPDGTVHNSVEIEVLRNGESFGQIVSVGSVEGVSEATDKNFTVFAGQYPDYNEDFTVKYEYTVREVSTVEGYTSSVNAFTVTNTLLQDTRTISGTKFWNAPESIEKPEITINLLQNGDLYASTTLANGEVGYEFADVPVYDENRQIYTYTVEEEAVEGFTTTYMGTNIINTIDQGQFTVAVNKEWKNAEGKELPAVDFQLYKKVVEDISTEGEVVGREVEELVQTITLSEATNWAGTFASVDKYDAQGQYVTYVVKEATQIDNCLQMADQTINATDVDANNVLTIEAVNTYITSQYRVVAEYTTRTNGVITSTGSVERDPVIVDLGTTVTVDEDFINEFAEYEGAEYIFIPGDSTVSVVVEKEGEDYVIRLIFVRNETTGGGGGGGGTTDPDPEPEPEPEPPTEVIPDTEIPGGEGEPGIIITPGTTDTTDATTDTTTDTTTVPETITIEDEETPLAMLPDIPAIIPEVPTMISEETIDIIEDEVPLGDAPQTGDNTKTKSFAIILVAAMAALLAMVTGKKRKEN